MRLSKKARSGTGDRSGAWRCQRGLGAERGIGAEHGDRSDIGGAGFRYTGPMSLPGIASVEKEEDDWGRTVKFFGPSGNSLKVEFPGGGALPGRMFYCGAAGFCEELLGHGQAQTRQLGHGQVQQSRQLSTHHAVVRAAGAEELVEIYEQRGR